jgi:hypothetical protein
MNRDNRFGKLRTIPGIVGVDHRFFLNEDGKDRRIEKLPRKQRRELAKGAKKIAKKYNQILQFLQRSGVGYPIDKFLRQLATEYTHRYASSGVATQPASFNYFEPFCSIDLIEESFAPYAMPVREIDHVFNVADYFDYLTADDAPNFNLSDLMALPEDVTHHFTQNGNIDDFTYLTSEGREFLISGFSMIRRGNSLHWYVLGGEVLSDEEWKSEKYNQKVEMTDTPAEKIPFLSESIKESGSRTGGPVALDGTTNAIRTIIAGETDLVSGKHVARCHMAETEHSFALFCDDPDTFSGIRPAEHREEVIATMKARVDGAAVMWHLAEGFFQLPSYFTHRLTVPKAIVQKSGKAAPRNTKGGAGIGTHFKHVTSIGISDVAPSVVRSYRAPHLEVDTTGYWRQLPRDKFGEDANGNKIKGRTWIKVETPWRARSDELRPVYIKSSVGAAKVQVADYIKLAENSDATSKKTNTENGVLYVMRCVAMNDEVYKVGWTSNSAEQRARELSTATGVPLAFVVVESWRHKDAEALEKGVHAMLGPYRLNNSREFFKLSYPDLKAIIETEINRSQRGN